MTQPQFRSCLFTFVLIYFSSNFLCFAQQNEATSNAEAKDETTEVPLNIIPHHDSCKKFINEPEKLKNCTASMINRHINMKFNSSLFNHFPPDRYRVSVKFDIDKNGDIVNILARGPHPDMEKEAIRVMKLLPQMNPGLVNNEPKKVNYGLPINFVIQKNKRNRKSRKKTKN